MLLNIQPPPALTGNTENDVKNIWNWSYELHRKLRDIFINLDDDNITSLSESKLINRVSETTEVTE